MRLSQRTITSGNNNHRISLVQTPLQHLITAYPKHSANNHTSPTIAAQSAQVNAVLAGAVSKAMPEALTAGDVSFAQLTQPTHDGHQFAFTQPMPADDVNSYSHTTLFTGLHAASAMLNMGILLSITPDASQETLAPLTLPTLNKQYDVAAATALLTENINTVWQGDSSTLLNLLDVVLTSNRIQIRNYPAGAAARLQLMQGLQLLLPPRYRALLTYSSVATSTSELPHILFCDADADAILVLDWQTIAIDLTHTISQPYVAALCALADNHPEKLVEVCYAMPAYPNPYTDDTAPTEQLNIIAKRYQTDIAIQNGAATTPQDLIESLQTALPMDDHTQFNYISALLYAVLQTRDEDASAVVLAALQADAALDDRIRTQLQTDVSDMPDAVYTFVRSRISQNNDDDAWYPLLQTAATQSLAVAQEADDPATLVGWLRLLSREPAKYGLADIVREGVLTAIPRAPESDELTHQLLVIGVKHDEALLAQLMADEHILPTLHSAVGDALRGFESGVVDTVAADKRELFLLIIGTAIEQEQTCITEFAVQRLWDIYLKTPNLRMVDAYRPINLLKSLTNGGGVALMPGVLGTLLSRMLADDTYDDLFQDVVANLSTHLNPEQILAPALLQSGRNMDDVQIIVNNLLQNEVLTPPQIAAVYARLLTDGEWQETMHGFLEPLARLLMQQPDIQLSPATDWKLLEIAQSIENDYITRVAVPRVCAHIEALPLDDRLVDALKRLLNTTRHHDTARNSVAQWWRYYTRTQTLAHLQNLTIMLDNGGRELDSLNTIVSTTLSIRRLLGPRSLPEFATEINTTLSVLQAFSESFDPPERSGSEIDTATIGDWLNNTGEELLPDERHVLAMNLRELGQLISSLAVNRTKPTLIGRDDAVDRRITSGEQAPQGAVDVMKWLAGNLDYTQFDDDV